MVNTFMEVVDKNICQLSNKLFPKEMVLDTNVEIVGVNCVIVYRSNCRGSEF